MIHNFPPLPDLLRACDLYMQIAYASAKPPSNVTKDLAAIRAPGELNLAQLSICEHDGSSSPSQLALRLGNRFYPHMKLAIQSRPDRLGYTFRVETHDQHLLSSEALTEWDKFEELLQSNARIAHEIEQAWFANNLPTGNAVLPRSV